MPSGFVDVELGYDVLGLIGEGEANQLTVLHLRAPHVNIEGGDLSMMSFLGDRREAPSVMKLNEYSRSEGDGWVKLIG